MGGERHRGAGGHPSRGIGLYTSAGAASAAYAMDTGERRLISSGRTSRARASTPDVPRAAGRGEDARRPSTVGDGEERGNGGRQGEVQWRDPVSLPGSASMRGRRRKVPRAASGARAGGSSSGGSRQALHAAESSRSTSGLARDSMRPSSSSLYNRVSMLAPYVGESSAHLSRVYGATVRLDLQSKMGAQKLARKLRARSEMEKLISKDRVFAPYFGDGTNGLTPLDVPGEGINFIPLKTVDPDAWKTRVEDLVRARLTSIRQMDWWEPPKSYKVAEQGGEGPQSPRKSSSPTRGRRTPGGGSPRGRRKQSSGGSAVSPEQPRRLFPDAAAPTSPLPSRLHPEPLLSGAHPLGSHISGRRAQAAPGKRRPKFHGPSHLTFYGDIQEKANMARNRVGKAATMFGKSFDNIHAGERRLPVFEYDRYEIRPGPSFRLDVDGSPVSSRQGSPGASRPGSVRGRDEHVDLMRKLFEDEYREMDAEHRQQHLKAVLLMQAKLRGKLARIRMRANEGEGAAERILSAHYSTPGKERASRIMVISKIQRTMRKKASAAREVIANSAEKARESISRMNEAYSQYGLTAPT